MKKIVSASFLMLNLLCVCNSIWAEEQTNLITDRVPSAKELNSLLFGNNESPPDTEEGSRSASFVEKNSASFVKKPQSIGLPINFESGKDTLAKNAIPYLEQFGELLSNPENASKSLKIEGYTDATGSKQANLELSKRRAAAVKQYLVEKFNIASERLSSEGFGEENPLPNVDPYDAKNRRVEFKAR